MNVKKLTHMAVLLAVALTIFLVEAQFPPPVPIAGVKLGLSNIVTLVAMVSLGRKEAFVVLLGRVTLGAVFAGQAVSFVYSLCGALVCFLVMSAALYLIGRKKLWVVSVLGAIGHNIGQIAAAVFLTGNPAAAAYLPVLIISGVLTGTLTGLCAQILLGRIDKIK